MKKIRVDFYNLADANRAVKALKNMGHLSAHLDMVEKMRSEYSEEISFTKNRNTSSLSGLVLKSRECIMNPNRAPLLAADPMVNGIGTYVGIVDTAVTCLQVCVEEDKAEAVESFLRKSDGSMI